VAEALKGLADRITQLEHLVADITGTEPERPASVTPLRRDKGQNPAGG
jgi:hypothetical protein